MHHLIGRRILSLSLFLAPLLIASEGLASPEQHSVVNGCVQESLGATTVRSEICQRVKAIIVESAGVEEAMVVDEASFVEDLGMDELDVAELFMAIEDNYGFDIPDHDSERITTVGGLCKYVIWRMNS